jgi:hypothetical protein
MAPFPPFPVGGRRHRRHQRHFGNLGGLPGYSCARAYSRPRRAAAPPRACGIAGAHARRAPVAPGRAPGGAPRACGHQLGGGCSMWAHDWGLPPAAPAPSNRCGRPRPRGASSARIADGRRWRWSRWHRAGAHRAPPAPARGAHRAAGIAEGRATLRAYRWPRRAAPADLRLRVTGSCSTWRAPRPGDASLTAADAAMTRAAAAVGTVARATRRQGPIAAAKSPIRHLLRALPASLFSLPAGLFSCDAPGFVLLRSLDLLLELDRRRGLFSCVGRDHSEMLLSACEVTACEG